MNEENIQNQKTEEILEALEDAAEQKPEKAEEQKKEQKIEEVDYKDKYLRLLAESENARKRMQKEKSEAISFATDNVICEFLTAIDNFENALKFAQNASEEVKNWALGFSMIQSQLRDILFNHGVVAFHSEGNIFDPDFHEAMEMVETTNYPDGTIIEEYAKGYKSSKRTIRPAKVKVAKAPAIKEEAASEKDLKQNNEVIHE